MTENDVSFEFPTEISDKFGEEYPVKLIDGNLSVILKFQFLRQNAGQLCLTRTFPVLRIEDLLIRNDLLNVTSNPLLRFLSAIRLRPKSVSLRGRGLGNALLNVAKEYAVTQGFEAIEGRLARKDLSETVYLREFYRKAGFQIIQERTEEKIWPDRSAALQIACLLCFSLDRSWRSRISTPPVQGRSVHSYDLSELNCSAVFGRFVMQSSCKGVFVDDAPLSRMAAIRINSLNVKWLSRNFEAEEIWSERRDSNPRRSPWQGDALPD
jgi:hypothetical protein